MFLLKTTAKLCMFFFDVNFLPIENFVHISQPCALTDTTNCFVRRIHVKKNQHFISQDCLLSSWKQFHCCKNLQGLCRNNASKRAKAWCTSHPGSCNVRLPVIGGLCLTLVEGSTYCHLKYYDIPALYHHLEKECTFSCKKLTTEHHFFYITQFTSVHTFHWGFSMEIKKLL